RDARVGSLDVPLAPFNSGLKTAGRKEKASFTHFIAWALVQAAKQHPVMTQSFALLDGAPHRVVPEGVNLGLAVDVERKDGSRVLVVPVLKHAERLHYGEFQAAYDRLVDQARGNKLMPDDYAGASLTLTHPSGFCSAASVRRLT